MARTINLKPGQTEILRRALRRYRSELAMPSLLSSMQSMTTYRSSVEWGALGDQLDEMIDATPEGEPEPSDPLISQIDQLLSILDDVDKT